MAVVWKQGSEQQFRSIGDRIQKKLHDGAVQAMVEVMHHAVEDAKSMTQDRVDTGRMIESISSQVEDSARSIAGRFGFLGERQDYFVYQTVTGFTHWLSGEFIEPTNAILDSLENGKLELSKLVRDVMRSL